MALRRLCFILLLRFSSEETLMKTVTKKPDVTQICSKAALNIITMIVCKISTERSRGGECRLLYHYDEGFIHECDSRFTLMKENQTVFLHLANLTSEDSGNYTCECVFHGGMNILHLDVTVEDDDELSSSSANSPTLIYLISAAMIVIKIGFNLGLFYHMKCQAGS